MNILAIIKDATRYPLSDWKKILILGVIILLSNSVSIKSITPVLITNSVMISFLFIVKYIIGFFLMGYSFRIIKSSLADEVELPEFNAWFNMFIDGVKVIMVFIAYAIPSILIMLVFVALSFTSTLGIIESNPSTFVADIILGSGIWGLIAILYMIIIYPLIVIAITNMAHKGSKLGAAFRLREILKKISNIGWGKLVVWYIVTVIVFLILVAIGGLIIAIVDVLIHPIVGQLLILLILLPYLYMYFARSTALIYKS